MESIKNAGFGLQLSKTGIVEELFIHKDEAHMNWVVEKDYIQHIGYPDEDKLFGHFLLKVNQIEYSSVGIKPEMLALRSAVRKLVYSFDGFEVHVTYDLDKDEESLHWTISLVNRSGKVLEVNEFSIWSSVSYIMYRDHDVHRNMDQSCAVFPSISPHFSKLACVRRSNVGPHLGIYATGGKIRTVGTYCRFENNFFKNVSPSLDGLLYHSLILTGSGTNGRGTSNSDWIYAADGEPLKLSAGSTSDWEFVMKPFDDQKQFYANALEFGHPVIEYCPFTVAGGMFSASFQLPDNGKRADVWMEAWEEGVLRRTDLKDSLMPTKDGFELNLRMKEPGERKLGITLEDGKTDFVVFNVSPSTKEIIETRVDYMCRELYQGPEQQTPHAFVPLSNQGESLGKLALILMKNVMGNRDLEQIHKVENSAVHYMKPKWFVNGDFYKPAKLYGNFYRIIDLDYIAHVYYLLSKFDASELTHESPLEYLKWAAEVMIVRLDEQFHKDERERKETEMLGVYILFIHELLHDLAENGLTDAYERLSSLWNKAGERIRLESVHYKGAVTEHFYDNAGFGPTCEALCLLNYTEEAERYGKLVLANIGYSNDFRAQNPDRWWEALSYMTHSLWGGMVAASALVAYRHLHDSEYLKAAYRATVAVFYCYDWYATATDKKLKQGEAASTYSVAGPNLNRPDLSRNRFGQSTFAQDGGLFAELFGNASGDDWDMGEELVAYLLGFGSKCFLFKQDGEVRCINGEIVKNGDGYEITSYAAYPTEYYFFEENASYKAAPGEVVPTVYYEQGTFKALLTCETK